MEKKYCQSCGMPMESEELYGTEKSGEKSVDYCQYCYNDGVFSKPDLTMEGMIDFCAPYLVQNGMQESEARAMMKQHFPLLKRWKQGA